MKTAILTLALFCVTGPLVFGQQAAQYSLFMLDDARWNPAAAGMQESMIINAGVRQQWSGLEASPQTQRLGLHLPLNFLSSGFGLEAERDLLGARQLTSLRVAYNYQLRLGSGRLGIGAAAGWRQLSLDGGELRTPTGNYDEGLGVIIHNDVLLPEVNLAATTPHFGVGLFYRGDVFHGGFSIDNIRAPQFESDQLTWQLSRVYYGGAGAQLYVFEDWNVQPGLWVRSDGTQTQTDFSLLIQYRDNIFGGASFRGYSQETGDAVALIAGFNLSDKLRLAYAYDLGISALRSVHNGSHELLLTYDLQQPIGAGRPPKIIYHPRMR
jgi:type IX secretion system PorP/SprF family membrane protein